MNRTKVYCRWFILAAISYIIIRYCWPEDLESKDLLYPPIYSEEIPNKTIDIRGGSEPSGNIWIKLFNHFYEIWQKDRAIRVATAVLFAGTAGSEIANKLQKTLVEASPILTNLPGLDLTHRKIKRLLTTLPKLSTLELFNELKKIVVDPTIPLEEKRILIQKILKSAFVSLKGLKRRAFLYLLIGLLAFLLTNNSPLFSALVFWAREMALKASTKDGVIDFMVETYREYNAPMPKELIELLTNVE